MALALLCFGLVFYIAYFSLYEVTIYCERDSLDSDVRCSVGGDYLLRGNIELLRLQPIKNARIDRGSESGCRIELITPNGGVVYPLGSAYSSLLCGTDFKTEIEPFFNYNQRLGQQTIEISDNFIPWVFIVIIVGLGIFFGYLLPSTKFLHQVVFDRTTRKITLTHVNTYRSYQREYRFNDVIKVVFTGDSKSSSGAKSISPDGDFYLLLIDFKKVYVSINLDTTEDEKYEMAYLMEQILAS